MLSSAAALADAPTDAVMTPIRQFVDGFNRGDIKAAEAAHAGDVAIIDEVPPHEWHGVGAFSAWVADLEKASKAAGQTDEKVTLGKPTRTQIDGDTAYVVTPVVFTFKRQGKPMIEPAQMAIALRNGTAGWKISAWAWTGSAPHPAQTKAKTKH